MRDLLVLTLSLLLLTSCTSPAPNRSDEAPRNGPPIRLILRGDDIGMTQGSIVAVKKSFDDGVLTCASFIAPAPWFPAAAKVASENESWCTGVHLCLFGEWEGYRWRPVLARNLVPSLVDEDGYLHQHPRDLFAKKPPLAEIEAEFRAQIDLAKRQGLRVQYIDTHMMGPADSTYPGFTAMFERLSRDYDLPVSSLLGEQRVHSKAEPFDTKIERAIEALENLQPGLWLWVEHPGIESPEQHALRVPFDADQARGWVERERINVTRMYTDPRVRAVIERRGIELVTYAQLWRESKASR